MLGTVRRSSAQGAPATGDGRATVPRVIAVPTRFAAPARRRPSRKPQGPHCAAQLGTRCQDVQGRFRENMLYKASKYGKLMEEEGKKVRSALEKINIKMPDMKRPQLDADNGDNWNVFESVSQEYIEAKDRVTQFEALRARAQSAARHNVHRAGGARRRRVRAP